MSGSFVPVLLPEPQPAPMPVATDVRVAFQGEAGSFSEQAVVQLWRGTAQPVPMRTFDDVMDAAESGDVEQQQQRRADDAKRGPEDPMRNDEPHDPIVAAPAQR